MSSDNLSELTEAHPSEAYLIAQAKKYRKDPTYVHHLPLETRQPQLVKSAQEASVNESEVPLNFTSESPAISKPTLTLSQQAERDLRISPPGLPKKIKFNAHAKTTFYFTLSLLVTNFVGALLAIYFGHKALREIKTSNEQGKAETIFCLCICYFFAFPFVGLAVVWLFHAL